VSLGADPTRTSAPLHARHGAPTPSDAGRFLPGAVLAGRYRIHGLLGRGGMGEVYRADDLTLGQNVALKFLPREVEADEGRRARFLNEVKLARQIAHASVCRVYDVGEVDGRRFLSMEYVDGEDLAGLLRRIGRLPREKAVEIARQLCAGLAAAHEQGVLHRDLKPANVMIDGRGRAKITDFGLAVLVDGREGEGDGGGTPGYMAPEQLAGGAASVKTDLYALGLVLYELFTGDRPFGAGTMEDLARAQRETTPPSLTSRVEGLDPAVERAVLRCLRSDPHERPSSALAVAAGLPGGDPLAAALAAGETPSPELVANAGEVGRLSPAAAWAWIAAAAAGLTAVLFLSGSTQIPRLVALEKPPEVLAERSREIVQALGWTEPPADTAYGFDADQAYLDEVMTHDRSFGRWKRLARGRPPAIRFWFRQGSVPLFCEDRLVPYPRLDDPPTTRPGMVTILVDPVGRLERLLAVPPERPDPTTATDPDPAVLFRVAGLDAGGMKRVDPEWTPMVFADRRWAWEGSYPEDPGTPIRIEAASFGGRWVSFRIVHGWESPAGEGNAAPSVFQKISSAAVSVLILAVLVGGILVGRRNLRLGRGDRKGTVRIASAVLSVGIVAALLSVHFVPSPGLIGRIILSTAFPLFIAATIGIFYLALEPYLRRIWPQMIVSWVRLLDGRFKDALIGRDLLIGLAAGMVFRLVDQGYQLVAQRLGLAVPVSDTLSGPPIQQVLFGYAGPRQALSNLVAFVDAALVFPLGLLVLLLLFRILLRRDVLAIALLLLVLAPAGMREGVDPIAWTVWSLAGVGIALFVLFRCGLLSQIVASFVTIALGAMPMTLSTSAWYSGMTLMALATFAAIAVYGYRVAVGKRAMVG
jgi:serine/threonine-protein kinase